MSTLVSVLVTVLCCELDTDGQLALLGRALCRTFWSGAAS